MKKCITDLIITVDNIRSIWFHFRFIMYLKSQLKYISDYDVSPHINKVTKSTRTRINVTLVTIWWHILDYLSFTDLILYYTKIWWALISEDELIIDAVNYRFESRRDHHFYPIFILQITYEIKSYLFNFFISIFV